MAWDQRTRFHEPRKEYSITLNTEDIVILNLSRITDLYIIAKIHLQCTQRLNTDSRYHQCDPPWAPTSPRQRARSYQVENHALPLSGNFPFHTTAGHLRINSAYKCRSPLRDMNDECACVHFPYPQQSTHDPPPGGSDWFRGSSTSSPHRKEKHTHLDATPAQLERFGNTELRTGTEPTWRNVISPKMPVNVACCLLWLKIAIVSPLHKPDIYHWTLS